MLWCEVFAAYFYELWYFDKPAGRVKMQTTSETAKQRAAKYHVARLQSRKRTCFKIWLSSFHRLDGESVKESPPLSDRSGVTWTIRAKLFAIFLASYISLGTCSKASLRRACRIASEFAAVRFTPCLFSYTLSEGASDCNQVTKTMSGYISRRVNCCIKLITMRELCPVGMRNAIISYKWNTKSNMFPQERTFHHCNLL